jgi:excisionase family DNA binding protein
MNNPLLTTRQLAEHLQVSTGTVRDWAARGVIPSRKGLRRLRFDASEVDEALRSRGQPASAAADQGGDAA